MIQPPAESAVVPPRPADVRADAGRTPRALRWERAAAAGAVLAAVVAVAMHLLAAFDDRGPVWTDDEIGVLANARLIAGVGEPYELANLSYYPGWSIVLAPLWWFSQDPETVYQAALVLSAAAGALLLLPLAALGRRLGLGLPAAVAAAAVVTVAPSRVVNSSYVLTENFLTLMVACAALAGVRYASRPTADRAALLGLTAAAAFITHGRAVGLLGMTVVWFLVGLLRGPRRAALVGLGVAVLVAVLGFRLHLWVSGELYGSAGDREASSLRVYASLAAEPLLRSFVGQSWYAVAAWLALPTLGVAGVLVAAAREARRRAPGLGWWALGTVTAFVVVSAPSTMRSIAREADRIDVYVYGRYMEPVVTVLAFVGLVVVLRRVSVRLGVAAALVTTALVAVFLTWAAPLVPPGAWWAPINVPGLLGRSWPAHRDPASPPWTAFGLTAVAAAAAYVVLRRRPWLVLPPLLVYFAASSFLADARSVDRWNGTLGDEPDLVRFVERIDAEAIGFDRRDAGYSAQNAYQFWLTGRDVEVFDSAEEPPPHDLVISRREWPVGEALGARRVAGGHGDEALWVLPGAVERDLAAQGLLEVPEGEPLPVYRYRIAWAEADGDVDVVLGDAPTAQVSVRVENRGTAVWPALGTTPSPEGTVRVLLWWATEAGPAPVAAELPDSLMPGESVVVEQQIPVPPGLDPQAPLGVGLVHEGIRFFDGDDGVDLSVPVDVER